MALVTALSRISPMPIPPHYTSFIPGRTPFSTYGSAASTLVLYLASIFGIQHVLKDQKPVKLNPLFRLHNIILSLGSGLLLALILEEVAPIIRERSFFAAICNQDSYTPRLEAYYIVNYWFKYVELLDTVFLALKKKELKFLHVFHHSATAILCLVHLHERSPMTWVVVALNLMVHVLMYYYYYASAGGAQIWWKKHLTSMQISQFVIDLCVVGTGAYTELASRHAPSLPNIGRCAGTGRAAASAGILLGAYLCLFINFYLQTYRSRQPAISASNDSKPARSQRTRLPPVIPVLVSASELQRSTITH